MVSTRENSIRGHALRHTGPGRINNPTYVFFELLTTPLWNQIADQSHGPNQLHG